MELNANQSRGVTYVLLAATVVGAAGLTHATNTQEFAWWAWGLFVGGVAGLTAWRIVRTTTQRPPSTEPEAAGWRYLLLAAFLVAQTLIPLHYYLGDHPWDERFAWRMYSSVRVSQCRIQSFETRAGQREQTRISEHIHVAYASNIQRNRPRVAEAYLRWRCESDPSLEQAEVYNTCVDARGERIEPRLERRIFCESGFIEKVGP